MGDLVDPKWTFAQSMATYAGLMVLKFAQQDLIPFDIPRTAMKIQQWTSEDLIQYASNSNCSLDAYQQSLIEAVNRFESASDVFDDGYDVDEDVRNINEILMKFMKGLTLKYPQGLPSNKWWKQLLFAPGKRFRFIWDVIVGCDEEELSNAFEITVNAINDAAELLLSRS